MGCRCREGGEEVSSTWQDDMLARKVADSTYVPRAYLAVGLGEKEPAPAEHEEDGARAARAGQGRAGQWAVGSMEWFGG